MKLSIIIPSYWGRKAGEPFNEEDAVYDHPTAIDSEGTLARALESIRLLNYDDFRVVVLGAPTHASLAAEMERRIEEIVEPFHRDFPVTYIGPSRLSVMRELMERRGGEAYKDMLSLTGYSNIRNCCLVAACLTDADAAVLFDDDQVYEDPDYLLKVSQTIGDIYENKFVWGVAGYYVNADGNYLLPENRDWVYSEWPAVKTMNEAFGAIESGEGLKITPWVFGGNMVIHRNLYTRLAFDPNITRGEDIDYLINARFLGYCFFLDSRLPIRHLAPPKTAPKWRRFREDVDRFLYTRAKLNSQDPYLAGWRRVAIEELEPYPGRFLKDDLENLIFKTSLLMGLEYLSKGDQSGFEQSMANLQRASANPYAQSNPYKWYIDFRERWERCMDFLSSNRQIKDYVTGLYA
ncbi:MAG: hypothetical protein A2W01_12310 [Candidatus Solincola sediminis]|nr:MAG: hypothetical protein A2W01_12310 [Candidatus Solincola sediminis]